METLTKDQKEGATKYVSTLKQANQKDDSRARDEAVISKYRARIAELSNSNVRAAAGDSVAEEAFNEYIARQD